MKPIHLALLTSCLVASLGACVQRDIVMVVPMDPNAQTIATSRRCYLPDDKIYKMPTAIIAPGVVKPQRAADEHVAGCAAVKFQIGADGKATNITVLREYPDGYGYGAAVSDSVRRSTYKAPDNSDDWFYSNQATLFPNQP